MLTEIKKQFYKDAIQELEFISQRLTEGQLSTNEYPYIAKKVFTISHQISGTGPMLGFDNSSTLSRKLEKTYYQINSGEKEVTPQLLWQTKRAIETIIKTINEENNKQ